MPDIPTPEDLGTYLKDLERRVRVLETAPRALDTTQPWSHDFIDTVESTSSLTYTNLATVGPTVTMETGNTSRVLVTASAYFDTPPNTTGLVGLYVDGVLFSDLLTCGNGTTNYISTNITNMRVIVDTVGLAPGPHTFQLRYKSTLDPVGFAARLLIVQPF